MHTESGDRRSHDHVFGQDRKRPAERRTLIVAIVTAATMVVEIAAGLSFGSMAVLADGLHMGSHASALAVSVFAYRYTRRHARDARFNFGTGKVGSLAAFASATMLALFALAMCWESVGRLRSPAPIRFDDAILVAVLGLVVNGACLAILHGPPRRSRAGGVRPQIFAEDHGLRSVSLHVLADGLTSVLAVCALLGVKYLGRTWPDPFTGIVGAVFVVRWSWGLLRSSARVLLDLQAPGEIGEAIRRAIESDGDNRVFDMHVWSVGPGIYAAEIAIVTSSPRDPDSYHGMLPGELGLVHTTFEVRRRARRAGGTP